MLVRLDVPANLEKAIAKKITATAHVTLAWADRTGGEQSVRVGVRLLRPMENREAARA